MVFHVLNRGVARMQLFEKPADYQAFEQVLRDALDPSPMRICAYAVMPNHWHLLLWPQCDGELAMFMQRLTITHVRRWQEHRGYAGLGHVYQGRYKSFPVQSDDHFWAVARYVERNANAPVSSCERRSGGGRVCGDVVRVRQKSGRCWRRGRSMCQRIGSSESIKPTTSRNWNRCAEACSEAAPLASRNGRRQSRNDWGWNRHIVTRAARVKWAEIKMSVQNKNRSGLGGVAHLANIGPVPLSASPCQYRTCPAFRFSLPISDLSRFPLLLANIGPVPLSASPCQYRTCPAFRFLANIGPVPLSASPCQYRTCPAFRFAGPNLRFRLTARGIASILPAR